SQRPLAGQGRGQGGYDLGRHAAAGEALTARGPARRTDADTGGGKGPDSSGSSRSTAEGAVTRVACMRSLRTSRKSAPPAPVDQGRRQMRLPNFAQEDDSLCPGSRSESTGGARTRSL